MARRVTAQQANVGATNAPTKPQKAKALFQTRINHIQGLKKLIKCLNVESDGATLRITVEHKAWNLFDHAEQLKATKQLQGVWAFCNAPVDTHKCPIHIEDEHGQILAGSKLFDGANVWVADSQT